MRSFRNEVAIVHADEYLHQLRVHLRQLIERGLSTAEQRRLYRYLCTRGGLYTRTAHYPNSESIRYIERQVRAAHEDDAQ